MVSSVYSIDELIAICPHRFGLRFAQVMLADGTNPLSEAMLTYHQMWSVTFTWVQFHKNSSRNRSVFCVERLHFVIISTSPRGQWVYHQMKKRIGWDEWHTCWWPCSYRHQGQCRIYDGAWENTLYVQHLYMMTSSMEAFSALLAFVRGICRRPVDSFYKGQWRWALMFSWIYYFVAKTFSQICAMLEICNKPS